MVNVIAKAIYRNNFNIVTYFVIYLRNTVCKLFTVQ